MTKPHIDDKATVSLAKIVGDNSAILPATIRIPTLHVVTLGLGTRTLKPEETDQQTAQVNK